MVAIIKTGQSIRRILNYNENKVKAGVAECLEAVNYPIDAAEMSLSAKLNRFTRQTEMNPKVKRNSVHISLNFDHSESKLNPETLRTIAATYMDKIGFGKQPYLVYQHFDAGHPHLHIVTTNVEADGKRIDLHHLGIRKSEPARKSIEKEFDLIVAEDQNKLKAFQLKPVSAGAVAYGKSETKMAMQNVLESVLGQYKYTSLHELNAVLNQYNVQAVRGSEDSRIHKMGGLQYRVLNEEGIPVGVPIKASHCYNKPTLKFLEEKSKENETKRTPYQGRIKNCIDKALFGKRISLHQLTTLLKKQGIHTVVRSNEAGLIYGITYVDHQTKTVFNGSDLGKRYSAKDMQERCVSEEAKDPHLMIKPAANSLAVGNVEPTRDSLKAINDVKALDGVIDPMIVPLETPDFSPGQLMKKKKKKKKYKAFLKDL